MTSKLTTLLLITLMMFVTSLVYASDNPMLIRVDLLDKQDLSTLNRLHFDIPIVTENFAEVVVYPEDLSSIAEAGLRYQVIHEDMVSYYQSRNPLNTTMGGFLTFSEILDTIDVLHENYPNLISARDSIGASWEGRALWVFKLSDNVDIDEDEPEVFYNALIHAREPITWAWQLYYINWLLANYGDDPVATEIIDERELFFLPVFNPDGYEYNRQTNPNGGGMWRKNRRSGDGVDLNRNWGYMWGYDNQGSSPNPYDETYRGPEAFSEPETQAVREYILSRSFQFICNAHAYGNYFLYPFGYEDIYTPDHNIFQVIGDSAETLCGYSAGTAWELLYNTNGDATDWQYGEQTEKPLIFCTVTESGTWSDGFWPSQYRIIPLCEEILPVAIYMSQIAGNVRAIAPPAAPVLNAIGEIYTDTFTVSWTHNDSYNPAVAFELVEQTGLARIEDDFESGSDNWQFDGFVLRTNRYHSYNHSLYSGNQNNYHGHAAMTDPVMVEEGDSLIFYTWYDIENNWDYAYVELSTDGGQIFNTIPGNITTNYNPNGINHGNGITGSSNGNWIEAKFPLDDYVGTSVLIEFSYFTDSYVNEEGIYIDDVYPLETFGDELIISSDIAGNSYLIEGRESGTYYYKVRAIDAEDQWSGFSNREEAVVDVEVSVESNIEVPSEFALEQNYPNPFNAQTQIVFSLASPGNVRLEVFDITGKLVQTVVNKKLEAGNHQVIWDGKNNNDETVSSGIYLYRLSTADNSSMRKMTLVK